MKASESPFSELAVISTGFSNLDRILGGGIYTRKITEISGLFSTGKSTLSFSIVAEAQKSKMPCLWADVEFSFDTRYAEKLGVDIHTLDLIQERYAEDTLDAIEKWADEHRRALIVIDSIGGLLSRQEAEKFSGEKAIGTQARLVASFCRKIIPILALNNNSLVVLNHQFTDIMTGRLMTSGGKKLEYSRSVWITLTKTNKKIMQSERKVGEVIKAEVKKNKITGNMDSCEMMLMYGQGFLKNADILQEALDKGIITRQGRRFFLITPNGENLIANNMPELREKIQGELADKIKDLLRSYKI